MVIGGGDEKVGLAEVDGPAEAEADGAAEAEGAAETLGGGVAAVAGGAAAEEPHALTSVTINSASTTSVMPE